ANRQNLFQQKHPLTFVKRVFVPAALRRLDDHLQSVAFLSKGARRIGFARPPEFFFLGTDVGLPKPRYLSKRNPRTHRNTRFLLYPASESTRPKNFSFNRQVTTLFSCVLSGIGPHHRNTNSNAHNINIITQGRVTLHGPVRSEHEKNNLQASRSRSSSCINLSSSARLSTFGGKWSSPGNHHTTFKVQPVPPRLVYTLCWVCVFRTEQWSGDVGSGKRLSIVHQRLFFLNGKPEAAELSDAGKYRTIIAMRRLSPRTESRHRKAGCKPR